MKFLTIVLFIVLVFYSCSENEKCNDCEIKKCQSNADCEENQICNRDSLICGYVVSDNLTPKELAEILFQEVGSEESCVDSNEYFYEECNNFEIEYNNMNDLGTERIRINNTSIDLTEREITTQSEYNDLLNNAKEKTSVFLKKYLPSQTFKLVKSQIVNWDEPCSVGDLCDSIVIVYERTLAGIPLFGYEAYFEFDLNSNYSMIYLGYLNISEKPVDKTFISKLNDDVVSIQNCDERIGYVSYGYYKINNEFEVVFLFSIQNGIYMISENEFNSCQNVIDKIDNQHYNDACEAMPCYDSHEDCIPYGESDYYCVCEEGYEYLDEDHDRCIPSVK